MQNTKSDTSHLPTKDEFYGTMDKVMGELKAIREKVSVLGHQVLEHDDSMVEGIAARLGILEDVLRNWLDNDEQFREEMIRLKEFHEKDPLKDGTEFDYFIHSSGVQFILDEKKKGIQLKETSPTTSVIGEVLLHFNLPGGLGRPWLTVYVSHRSEAQL